MKPERKQPLILSILIILGLIIVNFLIQIGVEPSYNSMSTDSGTFAYCGQVIHDGGLMYRDCWDNKPPGVYYLNALAISIAGANPFAIWLFQAAWLTIAVVAFFLIIQYIWGKFILAGFASFALLLVVLYPGIFQGGNFTETYAILPVVFSIGALWKYLQSGHRRWIVALGLLSAAGFLLKPTYISIGLTTVILIVYLGIRSRSFQSLWKDLLIFGLTTLLPLILVGLYWLWKGNFYELWFAVVAHNVAYVRGGFSLRSLYGTSRMLLIQQPMASLSVLFASSLGLFIYEYWSWFVPNKMTSDWHANKFSPGQLDRTLLETWFISGIFLAFILDVVFLASSGKNFGHYLQVLLPGMIVGILYLLNFISQSKNLVQQGRRFRVIALSAILIVSLSGGLELAAKELPSLSALKTFFSTTDFTIYHPTELEQYIIDHSSATDYVLVWAGHPGMNFVTHRRSPTRFIFLQHLFTPIPGAPNGFNEFLQDLHADPPKLIVVQPVSSAGLPYFENPVGSLCPGCDSLALDGMLAFQQFVNAGYELNYSIWDWVVYQRLP